MYRISLLSWVFLVCVLIFSLKECEATFERRSKTSSSKNKNNNDQDNNPSSSDHVGHVIGHTVTEPQQYELLSFCFFDLK